MSDVKHEAALLGLEKCERLLKNEDFLWFLEEAVRKPLAMKDAELRALETTKDARENAAHIVDALQAVARFAETQRDIYGRALKK